VAQEFPSYSSFKEAAAENGVVAVCVPISFDHETAVTLANRFVDKDSMFLLESATAGPGSVARYSFLGFDPLWTFEWSLGDDAATCKCDGEIENIPLNGRPPMMGLREIVKRDTIKAVYPADYKVGGPEVGEMGGACGFFGYDVAAACEPSIGKTPEKKLGLPDAYFYLPKHFFVLDALTNKLHVIRHVLIKEQSEIQEYYDAAIRDLKIILKDLQAFQVPPPLEITNDPLDYEACSYSMAKTDFFKAAEDCLEEVRSGEIFQVQIGNRLTKKIDARPFDVFRHLRSLNPSPYMFFFKFGDHHILGSSPEMMVNVHKNRVTHRPIAGTRKRTWDLEKDEKMRRELMESEKERAEHVMLVDLGRNDVGRISAPGSVEVEELMSVEEYSHVFHMVSQVSGDLADGLDAYDALVSGFPNGTVSGAPKIRAMQMINNKEKVSREFYAGSLGMFDYHGDLKSTILIRTIHMANGVASTQASAGIVYDSIPSEEWLETRNKMAATLTAMQNTK
jgi:anthranilate synthase component I